MIDHQTMQTTTAPELREPLWTFRVPDLGYSISLTPLSAEDRANLKRQAKAKGMSLRDYVRDEIVTVMAMGQLD